MNTFARRQFLNSVRKTGLRKQSKRLMSTESSTESAGARSAKAVYPKNFIQHAKTQTTPAFKIGITFLTLSLAVQLVNAKGAEREARSEMESLYGRIFLLEKTLLDNNLELPNTFKPQA